MWSPLLWAVCCAHDTDDDDVTRRETSAQPPILLSGVDLAGRVVSRASSAIMAVATAAVAHSAGYSLPATACLVAACSYAAGSATWPAAAPPEEEEEAAAQETKDAPGGLGIARGKSAHAYAPGRAAAAAAPTAAADDADAAAAAPSGALAAVDAPAPTALPQCLRCLTYCPSLAFYIAAGLQLGMFGYAAVEVHVVIQEPPARSAAFYLLFASSMIPLIDTLALAISNAADSIKERAPASAPVINALAWAIDGVLDAVFCAPERLTRPLIEFIEEIVTEIVKGRRIRAPAPDAASSASTGCLAGLAASLGGYGAVVRATPFKSFVALISFAITIERYAGALTAEGGAYGGGAHGGGASGGGHHVPHHGRRLTDASSSTDVEHLLDATIELLEEVLFFIGDKLVLLSKSDAAQALIAEGTDLLGAIATAAATSSAVTQQIKPAEYAAAQEAEQRRSEEMQSKREAEVVEAAAAASAGPAAKRPVPWGRIIQLGVLLVSALSLVVINAVASPLLPVAAVALAALNLLVWLLVRNFCSPLAKQPRRRSVWKRTVSAFDAAKNMQEQRTLAERQAARVAAYAAVCAEQWTGVSLVGRVSLNGDVLVEAVVAEADEPRCLEALSALLLPAYAPLLADVYLNDVSVLPMHSDRPSQHSEAAAEASLLWQVHMTQRAWLRFCTHLPPDCAMSPKAARSLFDGINRARQRGLEETKARLLHSGTGTMKNLELGRAKALALEQTTFSLSEFLEALVRVAGGRIRHAQGRRSRAAGGAETLAVDDVTAALGALLDDVLLPHARHLGLSDSHTLTARVPAVRKLLAERTKRHAKLFHKLALQDAASRTGDGEGVSLNCWHTLAERVAPELPRARATAVFVHAMDDMRRLYDTERPKLLEPASFEEALLRLALILVDTQSCLGVGNAAAAELTGVALTFDPASMGEARMASVGNWLDAIEQAGSRKKGKKKPPAEETATTHGAAAANAAVLIEKICRGKQDRAKAKEAKIKKEAKTKKKKEGASSKASPNGPAAATESPSARRRTLQA